MLLRRVVNDARASEVRILARIPAHENMKSGFVIQGPYAVAAECGRARHRAAMMCGDGNLIVGCDREHAISKLDDAAIGDGAKQRVARHT